MNQAAIGALTVVLALSSHTDAQLRQSKDQGTPVNGQEQSVEMHMATASGEGKLLGTIRLVNRLEGLLLEPNMEGLPPGLHGFHIHENPDCGPESKETEEGLGGEAVAAGAAGEHLDPGWAGNHAGPHAEGHVGDLPNLFVTEDGTAIHPVFAPRLKLMDVQGRSLVIHANPDNYSDEPENGGSGERIACGILAS